MARSDPFRNQREREARRAAQQQREVINRKRKQRAASWWENLTWTQQQEFVAKRVLDERKDV
jgi:hypothetical protein